MIDQEKLQETFPTNPLPQQFPLMQLNVLPTGVLITILYSIFKQEQILIPREQAEQLAVQMVLQMSDENFKQLMQIKKEAVKEKQLINDVIRSKN